MNICIKFIYELLLYIVILFKYLVNLCSVEKLNKLEFNLKHKDNFGKSENL